jgi:hypothetical protein
MDVATLAELLHETAQHHDAFEKRAPKHDWWDWYAPYLDAREHGSSPEDAARVADRYMAEVRHVSAASNPPERAAQHLDQPLRFGE